MKEKILSILQTADRALSLVEIDSLLGNHTVEEYQELCRVMRELEKENVVYHSNKDKYMLLEKSHLIKGVLRSTRKGFGFVEAGDPTRRDDDI